MTEARVLLVGESWTSTTTHLKGFDYFVSTNYEEGAHYLVSALTAGGFSVDHIRGHEAATSFPRDNSTLAEYEVVILSDIGANTLLLSPDTFLKGERTANRLRIIHEYVQNGGGLLMAGGYLSFQGIYGSARYRGTPIEEALPVSLHPYDDRTEVPEGVVPVIEMPRHEILAGVADVWPYLLGFNEVAAKQGASVLATVGGHPLLVVGESGTGRSAAWTSDIGPHWCPPAFVSWPGYAAVFQNLVRWLARV